MSDYKKSIFPKANSSVPKNKTLKLFELLDVVENSLVHGGSFKQVSQVVLNFNNATLFKVNRFRDHI